MTCARMLACFFLFEWFVSLSSGENYHSIIASYA